MFTAQPPVRPTRPRTAGRTMALSAILLITALPLAPPLAAAPPNPETPGTETPGTETPATDPTRLLVDPLLVAQAAALWDVMADAGEAASNPVWPGWDAAATPLLIYLPGVQDLLINHPAPPAGFVPYRGPLPFSAALADVFPVGSLLVRDGETLIGFDGQNTTREIEGVRTLVVADTLSNRKQQVGGLLYDPRPAEQKLSELPYRYLRANPYSQLTLVAHEAFHAFAATWPEPPGADELALASYPFLSVSNAVGFALEGDELAAALTAEDPGAVRRAAERFLALRRQRWAALPAVAAEYEDATEVNEGLAKYVEYRLLEVLEGRPAPPELYWAQGFTGFGDLSDERRRLIEQLSAHMAGEVTVNNQRHGAAPLRLRLYFSGMGIAALLDRLDRLSRLAQTAPATGERIDWRRRVAAGERLTAVLAEALAVPDSRLDALATEIAATPHVRQLTEHYTAWAAEGRQQVDALLAALEEGPGTLVEIDYSALTDGLPPLSFSPFGIVPVGDGRIFFTQVPITARFADGYRLQQTAARPLLVDRERNVVRFRLPDLEPGATPPAAGPLDLDLPEAKIEAARGRVETDGGLLRIVLEAATPTAAPGE